MWIIGSFTTSLVLCNSRECSIVVTFPEGLSEYLRDFLKTLLYILVAVVFTLLTGHTWRSI